MSDSVRPNRWQPTRLPRPWDSPGKNTGVGCHFLLQCMKVKSESEVAQSCPILSSSIHVSRVNGGFLQDGLCHTHVFCSQSPCPCSRPLLTHTSTGDTQTLKGRSDLFSVGSPCVQKVLFEPSERLW